MSLLTVGSELWFCDYSACKLVRMLTDRFIDFVQWKVFEGKSYCCVEFWIAACCWQMNDGPLCCCSAKARRYGIRHGIYSGETHLPKCNPNTNNADRLYHYRITISPPTNFLVSVIVNKLIVLCAKHVYRIWDLRASCQCILRLLSSGMWHHVILVGKYHCLRGTCCFLLYCRRRLSPLEDGGTRFIWNTGDRVLISVHDQQAPAQCCAWCSASVAPYATSLGGFSVDNRI